MPSTPLLEHYRRLLSLPWGGRDSAGSVGTCGQSGTSSCRVPAAQQERGRLGGLRRAPLDGMASSSNAFVHGHVVFSDGNASGKKMDSCDDVAPDPRRHRVAPSPGVSMRDDVTLAA